MRERAADEPDGLGAWIRLAVAVLASTIGGAGMWAVVVALPSVQEAFGATRSAATLAYTLAMVGFAFGGVLFGRLSDRRGVALSVAGGALCLGGGYAAAAAAPSLAVYALAHALVGLGTSASFSPLLADISRWFVRRRGIAVATCASGNYLAGVVWPPAVRLLIDAGGWRTAHAVLAAVCLVTLLPLALLLRPKPTFDAAAAATRPSFSPGTLAVGPWLLQGLLAVAGLACCVAMAMPQVHIVAYCGDLGYGVARGAEMLSLMLGFGIVSRIGTGFVADRIGGLRTLFAGSLLQGAALLLYLLFDGLGQLYVISALFGLFQGGIVPSYAIIVREYFPEREAGSRIGLCIMATIVGMALGGWMSGAIFDGTGSYRAAFLNGLAWNLLNVAIALFLLMSRQGRRGPAAIGGLAHG